MILIFVSIGICISWHRHQLDSFDDWLWCLIMEDETIYAKGYSESAFKKIKIGIKKEQVINLIGKPLAETWLYSNDYLSVVSFEDDKVVHIDIGENMNLKKIKIGMIKKEVLQNIGKPLFERWGYSKRIKDVSYRVRFITFAQGLVVEVYHDVYID